MRLYIHPLCYSSYKLIKNSSELLKKHSVAVKTIENPVRSEALRNEIVSVPYLEETSGKPLAVDPLDSTELQQIIEKGRGSLYEPWKMLARSLLASGYLTTLLILHGPEQSPQLLPRKFIEAALRTHVGGSRPEDFWEDSGFWEKVWTRFWEKAGTVVAYNFARHTYWGLRLVGSRPTADQLRERIADADEVTLARWVVSMSSLGRAGNPVDFGNGDAGERVREVAGRALDVLRGENVAEWIVEKEQGVIEGDVGFWRVLKELTLAE